ncbi:winged helix-turn-helix domain-containing protein [Allokutzneria albata]|uniref:winged helix-turn-helix domain-containing protein n=1 Tax=Allokutzneria albata TaxID=211114 RepID=UPI000ABCA5FC|nr:winged helix-turn-helix domain-containing protein [Allokutzneria albata]
MVVGLPIALVHAVGWPLPEQWPTGEVIVFALTTPPSQALILNGLACACWLLWAWFTTEIAVCALQFACDRTLRRPRRGPVRRGATMLVGSLVLSLLTQRVATATTMPTVVEHTTDLRREPIALSPGRPAPPPMASERVRRGDSLWRISERLLGDGTAWPILFAQNTGITQSDGRTLTNPHKIRPGWTITYRGTGPVAPAPPSPPPPPQPPSHPTPPEPSSPRSSTPPGTPAPAQAVDRETSTENTNTAGILTAGIAAILSGVLLLLRRHQRKRTRTSCREHVDIPTAPTVYRLRAATRHHQPPQTEQRPARLTRSVTPSAAPRTFLATGDGQATSACATDLEVTETSPTPSTVPCQRSTTGTSVTDTEFPREPDGTTEAVPGRESTATAATTSSAARAFDDLDPAPGEITITVLGTPRVHWHPAPSRTETEGQRHEITGALQPKTRELLVLLAMHPDGTTREALVSALWGQDPPARPTNALHTALARLRHALAAATDGAVAEIAVVDNGRYRLDPAKVRVDYWRFATAVSARRAAPSEQARVKAYREVVNSYGGPVAEGMTGAWIEPVREAVRRDALDAVAALARALVDSDPQQTLDLLEIARAFDPYNELLYRDIMRLQANLGQADAIPRTLTLLTTRLAEIDEAPSPQARELALRLSHRDIATVPAGPAARGEHGRGPTR